MAQKTLSFTKRARNPFNTPAWESDYTSSTGANLLGAEYYAISYKFSPYTGSDVQTVNNFVFKAVLGGDWAQSCTYNLYLYSQDPAGYDQQPTAGLLDSIRDTKRADTNVIQWTIAGGYASYTTLYILIMVDYYGGSGEITLNHGGSSIVENYTAKAIPQISFGTISYTDTGMTIPINYGSNYSLACTIRAGNADSPGNDAELYTGTADHTGKFEVPIDAVTWFNKAEITDSLVLPIKVTVTGGNPSTLTGKMSYTENRQTEINKMKPVVSSVTKQIKQATGLPSEYSRTYIAGYSQTKVTATITRPTGAAVSTVKLSSPGSSTITMNEVSGSTNQYAGVSDVLTKDTTFTVTVTDERGLQNTGTVEVTDVVAYVLPTVSIDQANTFRCNSGGTKTDGGDHYRIKATVQISNQLPNNAITELTVGIKGAPAAQRHTITSGSRSDTLPPASAGAVGTLPDSKKAYVLTIIFQDKISGKITREYTLEGMQRDMVLNHLGGVTHLGIGTTPVEEDVNSVELPSNGVFLLGGIPSQAFAIPYSKDTDGTSFGKDFLNVDLQVRTAAVNASAFFVILPANMGNYENYPVMSYDGHDDFYKDNGWGGYRTVTIFDEYRALVQVVETQPIPGRIWFNSRVKTPTEVKWSGWRYHPPTVI